MMIFKANGDIRKNAYLKKRMSGVDKEFDFRTIGEGYLNAAIILTEKCIENNNEGDGDRFIYPILFSTIHGIEVYLKALYTMLKGYVENQEKFIGGHDIKGLLTEVTNQVKKALSEEPEQFEKYNSTIEELKKFISEIYDKTYSMDFTRYPIKKDKSNHFYIENKEDTVVNLVELLKQINKIYSILEGLVSYFVYTKRVHNRGE